MAIKIVLGNVGSGKTASVVREMVKNPHKRQTFSNIITKDLPNNTAIDHSMLVKSEVVKVQKNGTEISKLSFNEDFWKSALKKHEIYNVIIDEAHTILSSRRSMSKVNQIMADFIALQRKILGSNASGFGDLTLISQIDRRIDVIVRDMANLVQYCMCYYKKTCQGCFLSWNEHNEIPLPRSKCPRCGSLKINKHSHKIQTWYFKDIDEYVMWKIKGYKTYFNHTWILDIEKYFPAYNTLQFDNLLLKI